MLVLHFREQLVYESDREENEMDEGTETDREELETDEGSEDIFRVGLQTSPHLVGRCFYREILITTSKS